MSISARANCVAQQLLLLQAIGSGIHPPPSAQISGGARYQRICKVDDLDDRALRFIQVGPDALSELRGDAEHIAGSIAMPFMIGPATVSASVLAGARLPVPLAIASIFAAIVVMVLGLLAIKWLHGFVRQRNASLVERYVDLVGRASALLIGTIAVDMVLNGSELWWAAWRGS